MSVAELPMIRSSERGTFKNCPQSWWWSYVEGLTPRNAALGARERGTIWHLAMAEYYIPGTERGILLEDTINKGFKELKNQLTKTAHLREKFSLQEEQFNDDWEMLLFMAEEYQFFYKGDPQWEVICREETFSANIHHKAIAVGTIDLVVRDLDTGYVWEVDHKTGKGYPNEAFYRLDDQAGSYGAIGTTILRNKGLIGPRERVKGIVFSFAKNTKEDPRPRNDEGLYLNKNGTVSKQQPGPMFKRFPVERTAKQQKHQIQRMVDDVTVIDAVRTGDIPVLKSPGKLCPYCDFFQLCELDESRGDTDAMKESMFKHRDPYHDHRDGAENSKLSVEADKKAKYREKEGD